MTVAASFDAAPMSEICRLDSATWSATPWPFQALKLKQAFFSSSYTMNWMAPCDT